MCAGPLLLSPERPPCVSLLPSPASRGSHRLPGWGLPPTCGRCTWVSRGRKVQAGGKTMPAWHQVQWIARQPGSHCLASHPPTARMAAGCRSAQFLSETPACKRRCSRCCHQSRLNPFAGAKNVTDRCCCPLSTGTRTMAMWWGAILCPLPLLPHLLLAGYALHVRRSSYPAACYSVIVVNVVAHSQMVTSAG